MTYEEFLNKVNLLDQQEYIEYLSSVGIYAYGELLSRLFNNNFHRYDGVDKTVLTDLNKRIILFKWEVGGSSGGNCWNDNKPTPYFTGESEEEIVKLLEIYEKICPSISWLVGVKINSELKKREDYISYEYYGNNTTYRYVYIKLKDLYEFLKEKKVIE
jgi:hypothetical protein